MTTFAQAAGFRFIEVPADADGPALNGAMWYPCSAQPGEIDLGDITAVFKIIVIGVQDCPVSGDKLPLVVVSHGMRGDSTAHHDAAETLGDPGFIVTAIDYPGHTTSAMSRSGDLSVFVARPKDIERLINFTLGASPAASRIAPQRIGFSGFSTGGYTGSRRDRRQSRLGHPLLRGVSRPEGAIVGGPRLRANPQKRGSGCSPYSMTRESGPRSSPTRAAFGSPRAALPPSPCRFSCGRRNVERS